MHEEKTMTQRLGRLFNLSEQQITALFYHFYLAGFFAPERLQPVLRDVFQMPAGEIDRISAVVAANIQSTGGPGHFQGVTISPRLCDEMFPGEKYTAFAVSLVEYWMQNHFTKGEAKEVSLAIDTEYTTTHAASIKELAQLLGMVAARQLTQPAQITLVIGAMAATIPVYLRELQQAGANAGVPYILLSTRLLTTLANDNPPPTDNFQFAAKPGEDYKSYLAEKFDIARDQLTEGHVMRDRYEVRFGQTIEQAEVEGNVVILGDTRDAAAFYQAALQKAFRAGHIQDDSVVAVSSLQPHIEKYQRQVQNDLTAMGLMHVRAIGYGPTGTENPKILAQALAALIDTDYSRVAQLVLQQTGIQPLPLPMLRNLTRGKPDNPPIDETYMSFAKGLEATSALDAAN